MNVFAPLIDHYIIEANVKKRIGRVKSYNIMNVNTNSYTVGFACAMVLIVAALLAYMSIQLTPLQDRNIELEKKQNILTISWSLR